MEEQLNEVLRELRISKNLSQFDLAELMGVDHSVVSVYEGTRPVQLKYLIRVSKALDIPVSSIIQLAEKYSSTI